MLLLLFSWSGTVGAAAGEPIRVVQAPGAGAAQHLAVDELIERLRRIYPDESFVADTALPAAGRVIVVAEPGSGAALLRQRVAAAALVAPESFVVSARLERGREVAVIAGADVRGVVYGVYALLEKLGCGFFLSAETESTPRRGALSFADWSLSDAPLFGDRIVLDWHNFLSSATTWEFADWDRYLAAAVRLRFNDLMVHAYGNNPMFTFTFNGVTKPVGYFATTQRGRDWGTRETMRDVRPEPVIADYVAAARVGAITAGERALIVSLNLRWLPDVLSVRQAAGLEPIRYRLGTVQQEPLAQGASPNTYHVDEARRLWKVIDRASSPATLRLTAFAGERLAPGLYSVNGRGAQPSINGAVEIPIEPALEEIVIEKLPATAPGSDTAAHAIPFETDLRGWAIEQAPGGSVRVEDGALVIEDRLGCTVWWREKLCAPVEISYDVTVVDRGGPLDRVSDLNCFWMASDPRVSGMPAGRSGRFGDYDNLQTYYVGMGGNDNTTTRFRRYLGDGTRPLPPEHDLRDAKFLLQPNRTYHIRLVARDGVAEFWRDGERVFAFADPSPLRSGWFAFRTMHSHLVIRNLRITP